MPDWREHIMGGLITLFAVLAVSIFSALLSPRELMVVPGVRLTDLRGFLLFTSMALGILMGSLLPDMDGGGKVSLYLSPFLGAYSLFLLSTASLYSKSARTPLFYTNLTGYLLTFTTFTVISYGLLFIPKKHRGFMHRPVAAPVYGILWMLFHLLFWPMRPVEMLLPLAGATLGYSIHLMMDWLHSYLRGIPAITGLK
ncbi:MAG: metal-dependent hydrolase [Thermoplasmata archaeon]|nr:metal-dependent hydrolase [Thermoplasmata archaeon]HDD59950.1 hypothetical protein [Euryarchaeota archaeon]